MASDDPVKRSTGYVDYMMLVEVNRRRDDERTEV
jgi:hypothetical protein